MTMPLECSEAKPWGIHAAVLDDGCPRCGWVPLCAPAPNSILEHPESGETPLANGG